MPGVPRISPATGLPTPEHYIHTLSGNFVDSSGRTLLLRGVNLSGSSKAPPGQPSYLRDEMWEAGKSGEMSMTPFKIFGVGAAPERAPYAVTPDCDEDSVFSALGCIL